MASSSLSPQSLTDRSMADTHSGALEPIDSVHTDEESEQLDPSSTTRRLRRRKVPRPSLSPNAVAQPPPNSEKASLKKSLDEKLGQWLRKHHFLVFSNRITRHENTGELLTAKAVEKRHLIEYFSWFFGRRVDIVSSTPTPAQAVSTPCDGRPPIDALPTVTMETLILDELVLMERKVLRQIISVPGYWRDPHGVPYTGAQPPENQQRNREARELNRMDLVKLFSSSSGIKWRDAEYFNRIDRTAPNVTLAERHFLDNFSCLYEMLTFHPHDQRIRGERTVEWLIGSKVAGLFRSPITTTTGDQKVRCPASLGTFGSPAKPDLAMVMNLDNGNWGMNFAPLCFAGETKTVEMNNQNTPAQLAWSLHASINLLILYHLHTRKSTADPFPSWLYIFGLIQDEDGINIYAHYPRMVFQPETSNPASTRLSYPHWGYASVLLSDEHREAFRLSGKSRFALVSALLTIQAHAHFLTMEFRKWKPSWEEMIELRECAEQFLPVHVDQTPRPMPPSPTWTFTSDSLRSSPTPPTPGSSTNRSHTGRSLRSRKTEQLQILESVEESAFSSSEGESSLGSSPS